MALFALILTILIDYIIIEISLMLIDCPTLKYLYPSSIIILLVPLSMITYLKAVSS